DGGWTPTAEDATTGFLFTHLKRDGLSRLNLITFPDNNTREYDYTGCGCVGGNTTRYTDELGNSTTTINDDYGRLQYAIEGYNPDSYYSKAVYSYDEAERLLQILQQGAYDPSIGNTPTQTRSFSYDGYGRLVSETTPEAGTVTYTYTTNDQVASKTDARGITTSYQYDKRKLVTQTSYSGGGAPTVSYSYDDYGARLTLTDGEGQTSYSYNGYRQLQSETRTFTGLAGNSYTLGYSYNQADQVKMVNYSVSSGGSTTFNKNVNYAYNSVGALNGVGTNLWGTDPNNTTNVLNTTSFRASGAIKQLNYGNGLQLTMGYNANRQQPISMKVGPNGSGTILNYAYEYYDTNGHNNNRLRRVADNLDSNYTLNYSYDAWNRLSMAIKDDYTHLRDYTYDRFGNLTGEGGYVNGQPQTFYTLNYATNATGAPATNRILNVSGGAAFTYDAAGNLTSGDGQSYAYDGAGHLANINGGALGQFGYDGDGMRV